MIYKIVLLPIANMELDEAVGFYEFHQKGLGNVFLKEIISVYAYFIKNPFAFRKKQERLLRSRCKKISLSNNL